MNLRRAVSLLLILLALAMGGCKTQPPTTQTSDVEFTIKTAMLEGRMVFVGVGGEIEGEINPDLVAEQGDMVHIVILNEDGIPHDFAIPDLNIHTEMIAAKEQSVDVFFKVGDLRKFAYYCTVAGHRQMGMEGILVVEGSKQ